MSHEIKKDGKVLARYIKASEVWGGESLSFFSEDKEYIQDCLLYTSPSTRDS